MLCRIKSHQASTLMEHPQVKRTYVLATSTVSHTKQHQENHRQLAPHVQEMQGCIIFEYFSDLKVSESKLCWETQETAKVVWLVLFHSHSLTKRTVLRKHTNTCFPRQKLCCKSFYQSAPSNIFFPIKHIIALLYAYILPNAVLR